MKAFLAYFDLLGYKNFIENNTDEQVNFRTDHLIRNIEMALADQKTRATKHPGLIVYDTSGSTINCLNFSDTVLFWSNGAEKEDFWDVLKVSHVYNYFGVGYDFPARGCLVYGDVWFKKHEQGTENGGMYMLNMIYGTGLIEAHLKAECQNWAGCVIDATAENKAIELGITEVELDEFAVKHVVPYKDNITVNQYALRLAKGGKLNEDLIDNMKDGIARAFTGDNKGKIEGRVKELYDNTVAFLHCH